MRLWKNLSLQSKFQQDEKVNSDIALWVGAAFVWLWVSDITYIELEGGCCYLHLVTDAYSHKIVGWCLSDSLAAVFTLKALRMAIGQAGGGDLTGSSTTPTEACSTAATCTWRSCRGTAS